MTKLNQVYKCNVCGNMVEMVHTGAGTLVCCGQEMELMNENTVDATVEKHVPVIESLEKGIKVQVGSDEHPMDDDHYIEWIELMADGRVYRKHLNPGDAPEVTFCMKAEEFSARAYCNLHGLWKS